MKKLYRLSIPFFMAMFLPVQGIQSYPLILPSQLGSVDELLGLADNAGTLTWITTDTNAQQLELLYSATWADIPLTLALRDTTGSFAAYNVALSGTQTVAGNVLVTGSVVGSVFYEYPAPASYAPIANTVQNKLNNVLYIQDFGGVGDGQTNNYIAFSNAFSYIASQTSGALHIPAGNYLIEAGSTPLSLPSNCTLSGDGINSTILTFSATSATSPLIFIENTMSNVTLKNMSLVADVASLGSTQGAYMIALDYAYNNFTLDTVEINGGLSNNLSTLPIAYIYGLYFPALNTHTGTAISNCQFHNLTNPIINPFNSTQSNFSVNNTTFYNNYGPEIFFSGATGGLSNAVIQGCSFTNNLTYNLGASANGVYFSNGTNITLVNNFFSSVYEVALQLEGSVSDFVVRGNTFAVNGSGIQLNDANGYTPSNGVVQGNSITLTGTLVVNPEGINNSSSSQNIIISNNIIMGNYYIGISTTSPLYTIGTVKNNIVANAITGYSFAQGGFYYDYNTSTSCSVGLQGINASVNRHVFNDCIVNTSATLQPLVLLDPIVEIPTQTIYTGTTVIDLFRIATNDRLSASGKIYLHEANAAVQENLTWDGTTFSAIPDISSVSSGPIALFIQDSATNMIALQLYTTTTASTTIDVSLDGMYIMAH